MDEKYRQHLSQIFALFVSDDDIRGDERIASTIEEGKSIVDTILLTDDNMRDYWIPAITHQTYDIRPDMNWENLELLGDGYADSAFTDLFMERYPGQTQLFY